MGDDPCRCLDDMRDHRTQTSSGGFAPHGYIWRVTQKIPQNAEDVVSDHRKLMDKTVGSKLPRREAFHIHIRLKLTVVLLHGSMLMVILDDFLVWKPCVIPP